MNAYGVEGLCGCVESGCESGNIVLISIEHANGGAAGGKITDSGLGDQVGGRKRALKLRGAIVCLVKDRTCQKPVALQVKLRFRVDSLEIYVFPFVREAGRKRRRVHKDQIPQPAAKVVETRLEARGGINQLDIRCSCLLGIEIALAVKKRIIEQILGQTRCAIGASVEAFQSDSAERVPDYAATRNGIRGNGADLVDLNSADQFDLVS